MPKILIVDDSADNRDSLSLCLQQKGFEVVGARDGKEGVSMTQAEKPDLVLMDLNMPEMDGWEATRLLKVTPETEKIPVIALTAHAMEGDRDRALAAGCADYHAKPVDFPKLQAQIKALIQSQAVLDEEVADDPQKPIVAPASL
jgi:two-component system, cell cycle response regulator DivK